MFIASLFTTEESIKKMWCLHTMGYYSALRKKEKERKKEENPAI